MQYQTESKPGFIKYNTPVKLPPIESIIWCQIQSLISTGCVVIASNSDIERVLMLFLFIVILLLFLVSYYFCIKQYGMVRPELFI